MAEEIVLAGGNYCPYSCDRKQNPGLANEIVEHIFEPHGYTITHVTMPWLRDIAAVQEGAIGNKRYHIAANMFPASQENLLFPDRPFVLSKYCFFTRPNSRWQYSGENSPTIHLGLMKNYLYPDTVTRYIEKAERDFPATYLFGSGAIDRLVKQLSSKRVDAVIEDSAVFAMASQKLHKPIRMAGCIKIEWNGLYMAFSPALAESKKLLIIYNREFPKLIASGKYQQLLKKYNFPASASVLGTQKTTTKD